MRHGVMSVVLAAGTVMAIAALAAGQTPVNQQPAGGGGRVLDANLSATQGRINQPVRDLQALNNFNKAVADGTAGFGKSLRVPTATSNFEGFRGVLGSDTNYRFRVDSASGQQIAAGVTSADAIRYQFAVQSGQPVPYRLADAFAVAPRGNPSTGSAIDLRSTAQYQTMASRLPTVVAYQNMEDSRGAVVASPLQGLALVPMADGRGPGRGLVSGLESAARGIARPADMLRYERDRVGAPDSRLQPVGTSYDTIVNALRDAGTRVDTSVKPDVTGDRPDRTTPAGTDRNATGARPGDNTTTPRENARPTDPARPSDPTRPTDPTKPATGTPEKKQPTMEERMDFLRKEMDRINAARTGLGSGMSTRPEKGVGLPTNLPDKPATPDKPKTEPAPPVKPEDAAKAKAEEQSRLNMINRLAEQKAAREAVQALAAMNVQVDSFLIKDGAADPRFTRSMTGAEEALAAGRYFDAEVLFLTAQSQKISDVMSQIGMVHARIGAGVIVSAASSLDDTLRNQPEVIPVRYGPKLLPPRARAEEVARDLLADLGQAQPTTGANTGLLLAYLGYQYRNPAWLKAGLDGMKARTPADDAPGQKLLEVVSAVWPAKMGTAPSK